MVSVLVVADIEDSPLIWLKVIKGNFFINWTLIQRN